MIRVITVLNPERLLASMCSMGKIQQDWAACFDCLQYGLIGDSGSIEEFVNQHAECKGRLYTSLQPPDDPNKRDSISNKEIRQELIVRQLSELPKHDPRPSYPYVGTIKMGGRRFRATQAVVAAAKEAEERAGREKLGRLSPERTRDVVEKYLASLTNQEGSDCLLWSGPKSIRLYKPDGSTEVTRSPLSVATFLAFGKALSVDKIFRSCENSNCVNHLHLGRVKSEPSLPLPISELDLIKQLVGGISRPKPEEACLTANHQSKSLTLVAKRSDGRGQKTAILWKALYYLAFGTFPSDDDRFRVKTTCGYLSCINPDHLSLNARQRPHPQLEVLTSLGQLLDLDRLDPDDCTYVTDELDARALERFGARNQWGPWSPFQEDSKGVFSLSTPVAVAALSLRFLGWCLLPMHLEQKDVRALRCKQDPACINPLHKQEAIMVLAKHILYRDWVLMSFPLRPQHFGTPL